MSERRIALDVMGGDHGASVILPVHISLTRHPDIEIWPFGNLCSSSLLDKLPRLKAKSKFVHTEVSIRMDDKPSQALRYGRWKSSTAGTIDAVKKGEADVAVSAGNTRLMAMARFNTQDDPARPAIAGLGPRSRASWLCSMSGPRSGR